MTEQNEKSEIEQLHSIIQVQAKLLSNMQSYLVTQRKLIETVLHSGATVMKGYEVYVAKLKKMYEQSKVNTDGDSDGNTASNESDIRPD